MQRVYKIASRHDHLRSTEQIHDIAFSMDTAKCNCLVGHVAFALVTFGRNTSDRVGVLALEIFVRSFLPFPGKSPGLFLGFFF